MKKKESSFESFIIVESEEKKQKENDKSSDKIKVKSEKINDHNIRKKILGEIDNDKNNKNEINISKQKGKK